MEVWGICGLSSLESKYRHFQPIHESIDDSTYMILVECFLGIKGEGQNKPARMAITVSTGHGEELRSSHRELR
jgi:hypothetical protein